MTSAPAGLEDLLVAAPFADAADCVAHLRAQGLADAAGLRWLLDRVEELGRDDPAAADELASVGAQAADELNLPAAAARAHYLRARILVERGDLATALTLIGRARAGWLAAEERLPAMRTDLGRMHILDDLGRHHEAAETGRRLIADLDGLEVRADESADDVELRRYLWAAAHENLGVAISFTGDHARALECYTRAEQAYEQLGRDTELAMLQANRGVELLELGRAREALDVLQAAGDRFADTGDRLGWAKCQAFVAQGHQQLGRLMQALRLLETARAALDDMGADAEAARLRIALANAYLDVGLFAQADTAADEAIARTEPARMVHDSALAHLAQALARLGAGDPARAADPLARAQLLFDEVGDRQYSARAQLVEAEIVAGQGDRECAVALAGRAVATLRAGGWLTPLAWALLRLAEATEDDAAQAHLSAAAELIAQLRHPLLDYQLGLATARRYRRQGELVSAEQTLRNAVAGVDQLTATLPDHSLRSAFRATRLAAHDELVDLLAERGRPEDLIEACAVSDRAKSRVLVDLVTRTVGDAAGRPDEQSADRPPDQPAQRRVAAEDELRRLRADLNAVYVALHEADVASRRTLLRARADQLEAQVDALHLRRLARAAPTARRAADQPTAVDASVIGITFHLHGADVLAFVVDAGRVGFHRLRGAVPAVAAQLGQLGAQWSRFAVGGSFARRNEAVLVQTANAILAQLHDLLIGPLLADLDAGRPGPPAREMRIVPHGILGEVPFHALRGRTGPLAEQFAVTISPALGVARPGRPLRTGRALVLAVPDARAPAIEAEARAIASVLPGSELLTGAEASTAALRAGVPGPAVVHLACHGVYSAGNPLFSRLRLGDRWLTCAEALDLDLGGALVTLSACESGRHSRASAEPVGLAWAFLAAGAAGVLVSGWTVNDETTAELMAELYPRLAAGDVPAHALRSAQLAVAAQRPHPFHWASFRYVATPFHTVHPFETLRDL